MEACSAYITARLEMNIKTREAQELIQFWQTIDCAIFSFENSFQSV
jgi:hypothetical protein